MTGPKYRMIAGEIRKLPSHRLVVAERFAAMVAKENQKFDGNHFVADAQSRMEQRADRPVVGRHSRWQTRQAPTPAVRVRIELGG